VVGCGLINGNWFIYGNFYGKFMKNTKTCEVTV
jgi:hypothetical protein